MTGKFNPDINPEENYPVIFFAELSGSASGRKNFHVKSKTMEKGFEIKNDFCIRKSENRFAGEETISFLIDNKIYPKYKHDWYMIVAIEKADKVKNDRHLLTGKLIIAYRHAIREAYNHDLDKSMHQQWSHPSNQNTIAGIKGYIDRISKKKEEQEKQFTNECDN